MFVKLWKQIKLVRSWAQPSDFWGCVTSLLAWRCRAGGLECSLPPTHTSDPHLPGQGMVEAVRKQAARAMIPPQMLASGHPVQ